MNVLCNFSSQFKILIEDDTFDVVIMIFGLQLLENRATLSRPNTLGSTGQLTNSIKISSRIHVDSQ